MMRPFTATSDVDVVVIGAGNAGLTAAVRLAQAGATTLLPEQHNVPGGCATSFRRGRFEFEVALHQLSGLGTADHPFQIRQLLGDLGVLDRLDFVHEPDLYRVTVADLVDVTLPADRTGVVEALTAVHPEERAVVERFLELVHAITYEWIMFTYGAMSNALAERFQQLGGDVRYNCAAEAICTESGTVTAVRTADGDTVSCRWRHSHSECQ